MLDTSEMIQLEGFFLSARNEIVNPNQAVPATKYFWDKWAPELGPNLSMLIMQLRKHCIYNRHEERGGSTTFLSLDEIGKECGISKSTVKRELRNPLVKSFIKIYPNYKYNEQLRKKVRCANTYQVALDEPIHPSDEPKLLELKDKRNLVNDTEKVAEDLKSNLSFRSKNPVDNSRPKAQNELHIYGGQNEPAFYNNKTYNVNVNNVQLKKPRKLQKRKIELNPGQEMLLRKILLVTKDQKSEPFFRQIVANCSIASIENALEDIQTYAASGRKVGNMGALFTSRIKSHDPYFQK